MKRLAITSSLIAILFSSVPAHADGLFTGDVKLACEAVLCLSSGTQPSECMPSLQRYFSINHKKFSDTLNARRSFLNLCPASSQDANMVKLVNDITNGSGRCDTATLNSNQRSWNWNLDNPGSYISNVMPSYCTAYSANSYTDIDAPRYVGLPERGGYWVDQGMYNAALAEYEARIKAEDLAARNAEYGGY